MSTHTHTVFFRGERSFVFTTVILIPGFMNPSLMIPIPTNPLSPIPYFRRWPPILWCGTNRIEPRKLPLIAPIVTRYLSDTRMEEIKQNMWILLRTRNTTKRTLASMNNKDMMFPSRNTTKRTLASMNNKDIHYSKDMLKTHSWEVFAWIKISNKLIFDIRVLFHYNLSCSFGSGL